MHAFGTWLYGAWPNLLVPGLRSLAHCANIISGLQWEVGPWRARLVVWKVAVGLNVPLMCDIQPVLNGTGYDHSLRLAVLFQAGSTPPGG